MAKITLKEKLYTLLGKTVSAIAIGVAVVVDFLRGQNPLK